MVPNPFGHGEAMDPHITLSNWVTDALSLNRCSIQLSYGQVLAEDDSIELLPIHHQYHGFQDRLGSQPWHLPIWLDGLFQYITESFLTIWNLGRSILITIVRPLWRSTKIELFCCFVPNIATNPPAIEIVMYSHLYKLLYIIIILTIKKTY